MDIVGLLVGDVKIIKTPVREPQANTIADRFVGTFAAKSSIAS